MTKTVKLLEDQVDELMRNQNHILEAIKYLNEKVEEMIDKTKDDKSSEVENILESQAMLDEIIVKNSDDILIIKKTKDANAVAIKLLETKIDQFEQEIEKAKQTSEGKGMIARDMSNVERSFTSLKCNLCEKSFHRYSDLENHIETNHDRHQVFQCDQCEKNFILKWRLRKHMQLHTENNIKNCHYFNNRKKCPFEKLGCKFLHAVSKICELGQTCKRHLCPFRHTTDKSVASKDTEMEDVEDDSMAGNDTTNEYTSFLTSTPQKTQFNCEDCRNQSQCTDCYVRQETVRVPKVHFSEDCKL